MSDDAVVTVVSNEVWQFQDEVVTFHYDGDGPALRLAVYELWVPAAGRAGEVDLLEKIGDYVGTRQGLIERDGDSVKLAFAATGKPRPVELKSGRGVSVYELRRADDGGK